MKRETLRHGDDERHDTASRAIIEHEKWNFSNHSIDFKTVTYQISRLVSSKKA
jgi:hypothetical protein